MQARELMTKDVTTCHEWESLERAAQLMWERDVGALPILDAVGKPIAMITDRDVCMAAYTQGCGLAALPVSAAMSAELHTCTPSDSVELVEELMRRARVRAPRQCSGGRVKRVARKR